MFLSLVLANTVLTFVGVHAYIKNTLVFCHIALIILKKKY